MTLAEMRNEYQRLSKKLQEIGYPNNDWRKSWREELKELKAKRDERQRAFWPFNKAYDLQVLDSSIAKVQEIINMQEAQSNIGDQLRAHGEALRNRKRNLFIDFQKRFSAHHVDEKTKRYVRNILAGCYTISRQIDEFCEPMRHSGNASQMRSIDQNLRFENEIVHRFLCFFPNIKLETGWRLSYVYDAERDAIKFFLTDNYGSVCQNVFAHVIVAEPSQQAIIDAILFAISIENLESKSGSTELVLDLTTDCSREMHEICDEIFLPDYIEDSDDSEAKYLKEINDLSASLAAADIEFRIVQNTRSNYTVHYITFSKDNVYSPPERRNFYKCCENTVEISIGECMGLFDVKTKAIFEQWGARTMIW